MPESYPNSAKTATNFFSPVPRAAIALLETGTLTGRDVSLLTLLLDYKNLDHNVVYPLQRTLATRLRCSVDTIGRALKRLQRAGLLVKAYLRDKRGRLQGLQYDLSPTLHFLPSKSARARRGEYGAPAPPADFQRTCSQGQKRTKQAVSPNPQPCGDSKADKDCQANKTANETPARQPLPTVVVSLIAKGINTEKALRLVEAHGAEKSNAVVKEAEKRPRQNIAGWIINALEKQWDFVTRGQGGAAVTDDELKSLSLSSRGQISEAARRYGWQKIGGEVFRRAESFAVLTDGQKETLAWVRGQAR